MKHFLVPHAANFQDNVSVISCSVNAFHLLTTGFLLPFRDSLWTFGDLGDPICSQELEQESGGSVLHNKINTITKN